FCRILICFTILPGRLWQSFPPENSSDSGPWRHRDWCTQPPDIRYCDTPERAFMQWHPFPGFPPALSFASFRLNTGILLAERLDFINQFWHARGGRQTVRRTGFIFGRYITLVPSLRQDLPDAVHIQRSVIIKVVANVHI